MLYLINPTQSKLTAALQRPVMEVQGLEKSVKIVLNDIKQKGDVALRDYTEKFDFATITNFRVTEKEFAEAEKLVPESLKIAILAAKSNIAAFHKVQLPKEVLVETAPGVTCRQKAVGINSVGFYVPGGTAPLFSSVLMMAVPAKIAGCKSMILCTPPQANGSVNPVILYTAKACGVKRVYKAGGAQAIAAMAYGTESIPKVSKIFGPGNQYVTMAKQLVSSTNTAIDMPAGPSELIVVADAQSNPAFVASDLLSQAEHGTDSQVILLTTSVEMAKLVKLEIEKQTELLSRKETILKSLESARLIVLPSEQAVVETMNNYAPEHLILATQNAKELAEIVENAGSVFIGNYTPESAGDYASGTNHTLPTNGAAMAYSGLNIDSFMKKITFQEITAQGLQQIGLTIEQMAAAELLDAHKNAVTLRLKALASS